MKHFIWLIFALHIKDNINIDWLTSDSIIYNKNITDEKKKFIVGLINKYRMFFNIETT